MKCPACRGAMEVVRRSGSQTYACGQCGGRALTLPILRRFGPTGRIDALWRAVWERSSRTFRTCPSCDHPLVAIQLDLVDKPIELNACQQCQLFFFESGQLGPVPPDLKRPTGTLSPSALRSYDQARATALAHRIRRSEESFDQALHPDVAWWARDLLHFFV